MEDLHLQSDFQLSRRPQRPPMTELDVPRAFAKGLVTFPRMSTKRYTQRDSISRIVVEETYMACELCDTKHEDSRNDRELVCFKYEVGKGMLLDQRHLVEWFSQYMIY
jgi:hypothetical protein